MHNNFRLDPINGTLVPSQDRTLAAITVCVIVLHAIFFFLLGNLQDAVPIPKIKERLVVKTIALNDKKEPIPPEVAPQPTIPLIEELPPKELDALKANPKSTLPPLEKFIEEPLPKENTPEATATQAEPKLTSLPFEKMIEEPLPKEKAPEAIKVDPKPTPLPQEKKKAETPKPKPQPVEKKEPSAPIKKIEKKPAPVPVKKEAEKNATTSKKHIEPKQNAKKEPVKKQEKASPKKTTAVKSTEAKKMPEKKEAASAAKVDAEVIAAQEAAKVKRRQLLDSAQKSIAKIERTRDTLGASQGVTKGALAIPRPIESLQIETLTVEMKPDVTPQQAGYHQELASRMKLLLRLPDYGEIKLKLTLERTGHFVKALIVSSESPSNRKYIETTLPTLKYPSFGNHFGSCDQYTFVITLSNDY